MIALLKALDTAATTAVVRAVRRYLFRVHGPEPVDFGDHTEAWCTFCVVPWPCEEFVRLQEGVAQDAVRRS